MHERRRLLVTLVLGLGILAATALAARGPSTLPQPAPEAAPIYEGYVDIVGCETIDGWAWNRRRPFSPMTVDVVVDGTQVATFTANRFRKDLLFAGKGNGYHAFRSYTPLGLQDGQPHQVEFRFPGTTAQLGNSPILVTCAAPRAYGHARLWVAPNPYQAPDFKTLFTTAKSKWTHARSDTRVFKFYQHSVDTASGYFSNRELLNVVRALTTWKVDFALETAAVKEWGCSASVTIPATRRVVNRIAALKLGRVAHVAMDEPLLAGTLLPESAPVRYSRAPRAAWPSRPGSALAGCGMTMDGVAQEVAIYERAIRRMRPAIEVGDIEPWPYFSGATLTQWITAFQAASGHDFQFFHVDVDYGAATKLGADWSDLQALSALCRSRGIRFGVIVWQSNVLDTASSDETFYRNAMAFATRMSALDLGEDDVIVQSWDQWPKVSAPDSAGFTFTQLVRDYAQRFSLVR